VALASARAAGSPAAAEVHVLVQIAGRVTPERKAEIGDAGLELGGAIPPAAFVARLRTGADRERLRALGVTWIGELAPADKVSPALVALGAAARGSAAPGSSPALLPEGRVAVYVEWHRDVSEPAALAAITGAAAATPLGSLELLGGALVAVPLTKIADLAALDAVKWIEPASPALTELNDGIRAATGVNTVFAAPLSLDGQGVKVLIYDGGLVCALHLDLAGRVTHGENGATATHATHVAGTFGSTGNSSSGLHRGMAPEAEILSYAYESCTPMCLYNNPQDMAEDYADGLNLRGADFASNSIGANIASNGYDCSLLGDYEYTARLIDAIAYGGLGKPFLSFWAAGNERAGAARCGSGFGTTGVPAAAKNAVVVGASISDATGIASFSSLGPVDDGRMRPDVVAPGCEAAGDHGITSLRSCTGETILCGTSMATPAVAGIAALLKERLRAVPRGDVNNPATMKAILGCSARDRGNAGPDYTFGYGQVDAVAAIELVDSGLIFEGLSEDAETVSQWLEVPSGRSRLRVLLAWDDPPGEPFASVNLVNDLDLRLVDPVGGIHLPFVLDPVHPASLAARGVNHRDPSELVEVDSPLAGRWRIEILGSDVPTGPQAFGVAADAPSGVTTAVGVEHPAPLASNHLAPNVPNPFNPSTRIRFRLAADGPVRVVVFDLRGAQVRELVARDLHAGWHAALWDGRDDRGRQVASGVYRCVLLAGRESLSQPMVLLK
jgi:subtilisin family serine protease